MILTKSEKEVLSLVEELSPPNVEVVGGKHHKLAITNSDGVVRKFPLAKTPSDFRGKLNYLSYIKRHLNNVQGNAAHAKGPQATRGSRSFEPHEQRRGGGSGKRQRRALHSLHRAV